MFGIGLAELIIIAALALIFIGPDKMPEIARALGKAFTELKKAMKEVQDTVVQKEKKE
ncbi:MAG: twin-arginine translocase TatA/TatE family subunit [Thermodesulfobacteriota bacterium]